MAEAQRAYFNGNFNQVHSLISNCHHNSFNKDDKRVALELLINSSLILNNSEQADQYMEQLLAEYPLYKSRETDLVEFRRLLDTYELRTRFNLGVHVGFNNPDYSIMQYRSLSSLTEEPASYNSKAGISMGISGEWNVWQNLFLSGSVLIQNHRYNQDETILGYQNVFIEERLTYLSTPFQVKYYLLNRGIKPFVSGGINPHLLVSSKADLQLFGLDPDFITPLVGIPRKVSNYQISDQRKSVTLNYLIGVGIQRSFGLWSAELGVFYEFGLNNLVNEDNRYSDKTLIEVYSYVPDDFKMDHLRIAIGLIRSFIVPSKRSVK